MGLAIHPETGELWETENGPQGGDELNIIRAGKNYGWPTISYGRSYTGDVTGATGPDSDPPVKPGLEQPMLFWAPSIALSGLTFYTGDRFPDWKHHLFVTGLAGEALRRLETDGDRVVHEEIVFKGFGRVRAVITGPDGLLYIALNVPGVRLSDTTPGLVVRLVPAPKTMQP